ncbi:MAG: hypothetical protein ACJ8EF_22100 [Bradyrhizobium sp.]
MLAHQTMEASMYGSFERSGGSLKRLYRNWGIGIFVLPVLVAAMFIGLTIREPNLSTWIADAVQGEFVTTDPAIDKNRTQAGGSSEESPAVKAN